MVSHSINEAEKSIRSLIIACHRLILKVKYETYERVIFMLDEVKERLIIEAQR